MTLLGETPAPPAAQPVSSGPNLGLGREGLDTVILCQAPEAPNSHASLYPPTGVPSLQMGCL